MNIRDFSTGIDIEKVERFEKYSADKNSPFVQRIFTEKETEYCFAFRKPAEHLAVRFSAKEAVFKALSALNITGVNYSDIEILNDKNGVPFVRILNGKYDNLVIRLSLAHTNGNSVASVFIVKM